MRKHFAKFWTWLCIPLLCVAMTACATALQAVPPTPKTPQQTVYEVKAALVTAEDAGLAWAATVCPTASTCTDKRVKAVVAAIVTADALITGAETAVKADSTAATRAAIDAQAALTALQKILTQYGVATSSTTKGS